MKQIMGLILVLMAFNIRAQEIDASALMKKWEVHSQIVADAEQGILDIAAQIEDQESARLTNIVVTVPAAVAAVASGGITKAVSGFWTSNMHQDMLSNFVKWALPKWILRPYYERLLLKEASIQANINFTKIEYWDIKRGGIGSKEFDNYKSLQAKRNFSFTKR
jgi:hypothetical protein